MWIVASILMFSVTVGWYITQPVVIGFSRALNSSLTSDSARNVATAVEYGSVVWGPLLICFILLWAIYSSQQRDVESEIYG